MGGGNSRQQTWAPQDMQQNPEKIERLTHLLSLKSEHDQTVATRGWDRSQQEMDNHQMLKGLFKKLDPKVMKPVGEVKGEIQLSFKYDFNNELLLVKVIKCRELNNKDIRSKMADTFVKLELLPDPLNQGAKMTQIVHQNNNPRFDEIFGYNMPEFALGQSKLVVQVIDHALGGRDDIRGEVIINLNQFSFRSEPILTAWYQLNMETDLSISGNLDISVAFQVPNTLLVTVHGATDLAPRDHNGTADPFVKVAVPGYDRIHQTQVKKDTLNPTWAETFEFPIHEEEFENRFIIFHVIDRDKSSSNDSLGQCIVELTNMDPERGIHGSYPLADLRNSERMRSKVYQNRTAQEFREALIAHSFARAPNCLFKEHRGGKVVTVSCRKAGAQGRIRIVDGLPVY